MKAAFDKWWFSRSERTQDVIVWISVALMVIAIWVIAAYFYVWLFGQMAQWIRHEIIDAVNEANQTTP